VSQRTESDWDTCANVLPERNHYFPGKLLTARDFESEQQYFNQKRWLINRHVLGWGVVCGLDVRWDPECCRLIVDGGLALDCCGHEILVRGREQVRLDHGHREHKPGSVERLVLCLEYRECKTEPLADPHDPSCGDAGRTRYNRVRDSYALRVRPWDDVCVEGKPDCPCYLDFIKGGDPGRDEPDLDRPCDTPDMHDWLCECTRRCPRCRGCECVVLAVLTVRYPRPEREPPDEKYPEDYPEKDSHEEAHDDREQTPGHPAYPASARHQTAAHGGHGPEQRPEQEPAKPHKPPRHDPCEPDPCAEPECPEVEVDACTYRRFVYSNPLLYRLIECFHGDLPHVVAFGWRKLTHVDRKMKWAEFIHLLVNNKMAVIFDQPMREETINSHTFLVSVRVVEKGTGYWINKQIPCERIEHHRIKRDSLGHCHMAVFVPETDWVEDELDDHHSEVADGTEVDVTLVGSLITAENGKALDGDFIGYRLPSGNGTQGGDFKDWFAVEARPDTYQPAAARTKPKGERIEDF
jgi:hypothetical protein